jgi:hypothetical protein
MTRTGFGIGRTVRFASAAASAFALAFVMGVPAAAAHGCPQATSMLQTGYTGTGGLSYVSGAVTTTVDQDGDDFQTTSLDHHASGMKIVLPKPHEGDGGLNANGQPTGGSVSIHDTFNDTGDPGDPDGNPDSPFPASSATQNYSGPNKPTSNDAVTVNVGPHCTYTMSFDLDVPHTTEAGTGPLGDASQQPGEADTAESPAEPIPADLKLSATATIHPTFGGDAGGGTYDLSGDPFWGNSLDDDAKSPAVEPGTAMMTWQLAPTSATSHGCVVPHLQGVSQHQAASKLKSAGCKVGKITHKHSSSVHKGSVVSTNPKAGSKRNAGTKVALVLSSG